MKFYKRFPGDIQIKTGGLTLAEFGAYDRLLDHFYATEQPISPDECYSITRALTRADRAAVDKVLARFFTSVKGGWIQLRAAEMIAEALPKIEAARENGKRGGRPKRTEQKPKQEPTGLFDGTEGEPKPKTSQSQNQSSSVAKATAAGAAAEMTKQELWRAGKSLLLEQGLPVEQCGSFVGALVKKYGDDVVLASVRATVVATPADAKEYLKAACMRMKGERKDAVTVADNPQVAETTARLAAEAARDLTVDPERIAAARALSASRRAAKAEALQ